MYLVDGYSGYFVIVPRSSTEPMVLLPISEFNSLCEYTTAQANKVDIQHIICSGNHFISSDLQKDKKSYKENCLFVKYSR